MNQGKPNIRTNNNRLLNSANKSGIKNGRLILNSLVILVFVTIVILLALSHKIEPTLIAVLIAFILGFIVGKNNNK